VKKIDHNYLTTKVTANNYSNDIQNITCALSKKRVTEVVEPGMILLLQSHETSEARKLGEVQASLISEKIIEWNADCQVKFFFSIPFSAQSIFCKNCSRKHSL